MPDDNRMIKLSRTRSVGHLARMGDERDAYKVWSGSLKRRNYFGDTGVDEKITLK
jgi:hypothetical protein